MSVIGSLLTAGLGVQDMPLSSWERPADQLTKLTIADLYGLDVSDIPDFTRNEAMAIPAVAKIRNRIASKIGGFPTVIMKGVDEYATPPKWATNLEPNRASFVSWAWLVDELIFYGEAWIIVAERSARTGYPEHFRIVPRRKAEFDTQTGLLVKAFGQPVNRSDVYRIESHHSGLLCDGQKALKRAGLIEAAAERASENPVPSIELHQTAGTQISDEQIKDMLSRWRAARKGANGGVAYTNSGIETKVHGQAAEQLLISGRNVAAIDIARAMGAPAWMIDASVNGASITYGNVNARSRELYEDTIKPYADAICGRLSLDDILPNKVWMRFDPSEILRDSYRDRMTGHKTAIDAGVYTPEQVQQMEKGIPLERG